MPKTLLALPKGLRLKVYRLTHRRKVQLKLFILLPFLILSFQNCSGPYQAIEQVGEGSNADSELTPTPTPDPDITPTPTPNPGGNVGNGPFPILFVTSVPGMGFQHQLNTFGNHGTSVRDSVPGGDLWIKYPNGVLRNLTQEAGLGVTSGQTQGGPNAIAVRQPTVHWSGEKAIFSMAIGGPTARYQNPSKRWQMYEVTGLRQGEAVSILRVPNQPQNYNNMSAIYGSDDEIIFTSDAPIYQLNHTYPQLDEYESLPTVSGIYKLNPSTGLMKHIQHAPSGSFDLFLDSFGRIIFTRWDHLKRDQQADLDRTGTGTYGSFDFASEAASATRFEFPERDSNGNFIADTRGVLYDKFPEARSPVNIDRSRREYENLHDFNHFLPWQLNQDGSEEETVNHVGNDEMFQYYKNRMFTIEYDPNLTDRHAGHAANPLSFTSDSGFFQMKEDINRPGYFLGVYAKEFGRQASGRVIEVKMSPDVNPEDMVLKDYTNDTLDADPTGSQPRRPSMTGHYRNPLRTSGGSILVSHTEEYRQNDVRIVLVENNLDPTLNLLVHQPRYVFRIRQMIANPSGTDMIAGPALTPGNGIVKHILWWQDDAQRHSYNGPLNEHDMVEVRPRTRPPMTRMHIARVEKDIMNEQNIDETQFKNWLAQRNLAVIVVRNTTLRDRADLTQPFNLRVPNGVQSAPSMIGRVYDVSDLQIFQAELTRAYNITPGRRVYATPIRNTTTHPGIETYYPLGNGKVKVATDGSIAAIVPAKRALTWQLLSPDESPVVRERYWVNFAPGEVRTCASCHGINKSTRYDYAEPTNPPEAFKLLLQQWKATWVRGP